ncbi:MobF family relaxase [Rothia sp. P5764]|uniref:MobF family relaxase n=1 Tax=Rothia sp. P5764 TaxID=3402654 RepID=UPI003AC2F363
MTVSISRMDINYYLQTTAASDGASPRGQLTGYYTASGDPAGTWFGNGLTGIDMKSEQTVTKYAAIAIYEDAKHPQTGEPLGKKPIKETQAPEGAKTASGKTAKSTRKPVSGFDLTFSAPKSVSVLWALADNGTKSRIHNAHQEAVRKTLEWAEANVIQTRAGDGGIAKVETKGMIASLFDHYDSRAGDPQMHTHAVLANRVQRASDGAWGTLDSYALHKSVVTISEMYNNILFDELAKAVGAEAEQRDPLMAVLKQEEEPERNRRMELAEVPDELIAEFSQRTIAVETRTDELIEEWRNTYGKEPTKEKILDFRRQATLETRQLKDSEKLPLSERFDRWNTRAINKGYSPDEIIQKATGRKITFYKSSEFTDKALSEIAHEILNRTVPKHPTFTRNNLLASAHRLTANLRFNSLDEREQFANQLTDLALQTAVELTPGRYDLDHLKQQGLTLRGTSVFDRAEEKIYTTTEILNLEAELMAGVTSASATHVADNQKAKEDLQAHTSDEGYPLAPDQLEAALQVITSPRAINAIIGPAGTGKTSTLAGLRHAWESQQGNGSIIGLAPSAAAAEVLGKELGIPTDNTAKWIYESVGDGAARRAKRYSELKEKISDLESRATRNPGNKKIASALDAARTRLTTTISEQAKYQIKPGQLLIVDEASMSSTADLHRLYSQTRAVGAKMLLVGDPKQLDAVEAGGFLGWVENKNYASTLTSVWRFKEEWEKEASLSLRKGNPEVLKVYEKNGRISETDDVLSSAYTAWKKDIDSGKTSVLIAGRNEQVIELNLRAQKDRIAEGLVDSQKSTVIRTGLAHPGDMILARVNDRTLIDSHGEFIKNGTRMAVKDISKHSIIAAREDTGAQVEIPKKYAQSSVELGYACTIHRSQGLTVDTGHVAISSSYNREQLYVAMTRGKLNNQMHVPSGLPEDERPDSPDNWGIMQARTPESAMEVLNGIINKSDVDKTAHEVRDAEHGWANDLGRAVSELDYVRDLSATRRTYQWLTNELEISPEQIADRPDVKELIRAAKEATIDYSELPKSIASIKDATKYLAKYKEEKPTELVPPVWFASDDEAEAQKAILEKINTRVRQIQGIHSEQEWYKEMEKDYFLNPSCYREIIIWRAISKQEDAKTALGKKPQNNERRLTSHYQRLQDILNFKVQNAYDDKTWNANDYNNSWDQPGQTPNTPDHDYDKWPDWDQPGQTPNTPDHAHGYDF